MEITQEYESLAESNDLVVGFAGGVAVGVEQSTA